MPENSPEPGRAALSGPLLPTRAPKRSVETAPFWEACAEQRLVLPQCCACAEFIWYPRGVCPFCGSLEVRWVESSGAGSIYTFTVSRRGDGAYKTFAPYVIAYVTLDEGPSMLTNIVGVDPISVHIGQRVRVQWEPAGSDGSGPPTDYLPRFTPSA